MRKMAGALLAVGMTAAFAGCGVDKEGTADNLIESIEERSGQTLTDEQKDCLKDLVKSFSDDELQQLDKDEAPEALTDEFQSGALTCLADLGS